MIRVREPRTLTQGERAAWRRSFAERPATLYTLEYRFRGDGPGVDVVATADGTAFLAELTAEQTATLAPGRYHWQAWLTETADADNTFLAATGETAIKQGFAAAGDDPAGPVDTRTQAKRILDAITATLENRATSDQGEYEISTPAGSRKIKMMPRAELLNMREYFGRIVSRERAAEKARRTGKFGSQVLVRLREG